MPSPTLDIIIINWNSGSQLRDCLESISETAASNFELLSITIVDNASSDGSSYVLDNINLPLTIIRNLENTGFGAACNQGARNAQGNYLLLLNPDIQLQENTLESLLAFAEKSNNHQAGIFGVQLISRDGQIQRLCARFPTPSLLLPQILGLDHLFPKYFPSHFMVEWDHQNTQAVDQVPGGFFLIRRKLFEQLEGFDERFFMYFEDVDLSLRAKQGGWSTMFFADARVFHTKGGTTEQIKAKRLFYYLRSRIIYGYKHFSWSGATMVLICTLLMEPWARLLLGAMKRSKITMVETIQCYILLWRSVPRLFKTIAITPRA